MDPEGDREESAAKRRDQAETEREIEIWDVSKRCLHTQSRGFSALSVKVTVSAVNHIPMVIICLSVLRVRPVKV